VIAGRCAYRGRELAQHQIAIVCKREAEKTENKTNNGRSA
jgi:hypothetical protein